MPVSKKIEFVQNTELTIATLRQVAIWVHQNSSDNLGWWNPKLFTFDYLIQFCEPNDFYSLLINGETVAGAILTESQEAQSWSIVDGDKKQKALYRHWLGVKSEFRGTGIPKIFTDYSIDVARKRGLEYLRLDVDGTKNLTEIYKKLGFKLVTEILEDNKPIKYFQLKI
jgi:ribosomal protein S18 acetylase RimI-like enzyme